MNINKWSFRSVLVVLLALAVSEYVKPRKGAKPKTVDSPVVTPAPSDNHNTMPVEFGGIVKIGSSSEFPQELEFLVKEIKPHGFLTLRGGNDTTLNGVDVGAINPIDGVPGLMPNDRVVVTRRRYYIHAHSAYWPGDSDLIWVVLRKVDPALK